MLRGSQRIVVLGLILTLACSAIAADRTFLAGADVSMLPTIEAAGGVYRDGGKPDDALRILREHGCNLFRVRLFVHPNPDYGPTDGAVQDLAYVESLARRIRALGGSFMLDIHYSDTWADPGKQYKPEEWKKLDFDSLKRRVREYTVSVLVELKANGTMPDMVQVGNEITAGMVWPDGNVLNVPANLQPRQWQRFGELFDEGAEAVRSFSTPAHPIRIMLHIHGGGKAGLPQWFFGKFAGDKSDYDCIGLSFYPAWDDSMDALKQNMADLVRTEGKDVFIAETSYPSRPIQGMADSPVMKWPHTPAGQKRFLGDLIDLLHAVPGGHGIGYAWWYPEAVPVAGMRIWRNGAEGLFDPAGNAFPALELFSAGAR